MMNNATKSIAAKTRLPRGQAARVRRQVSVKAVRRSTASDLVSNFRRGPLDGIGSYVSEAFAQIFSGRGEAESVPWIEQQAFSGSVRHHETGSRHGHSNSKVYHEVDFGKKYEGIIGDDGVHRVGPLGWVTDTVGRSFFGANLNDQSSEPRKFYSTGYTGRVASARKIRRDVDRLGRH